MTEEGLKQLKQDEGFRSHPYQDTVGKWTIGYGRNLDAKGISEFEGDFLARDDVKEVEAQIEKALPWSLALSADCRDVLTNMAFNMGIGGLLEFKDFLAHLQAGEFTQAAASMLDSKWAQQVGVRAKRLAWVIGG